MEACCTCSLTFQVVNRHKKCQRLDKPFRREEFSPQEALGLAGISLPPERVSQAYICDKCGILLKDFEKGLRKVEESHKEITATFTPKVPTPDFHKRRSASSATYTPRKKCRKIGTPTRKKSTQSPPKGPTSMSPEKKVSMNI